MKVFAGLLALAVAAQALSSNQQMYRPDEKYSYDYRGVSVTGIPLGSNDRTGIAIWANVNLYFYTSNDAVLQLENPKVRQLNLDTPAEYQQWGVIPDESEAPEVYSQLPTEINTDVIIDLKTPIQFTLGQDGIVSNIRLPVYEPEWIFNIKKGILNQLQVQNVDKFQQKHEDTIVGRHCLVNYDIVSAGENEYDITKEFTLESCTEASQFVDVIGMTGQLLDQHDDILKTSFVSRVNVQRVNNRNFVKGCVSESRFTLRPFQPEHGEIVTYTRQELNYVEKTLLQKPWSLPSNLNQHRRSLFSPLTIRENPTQSVNSFGHLMPEPQRLQLIKQQLSQIGDEIVHGRDWQTEQHTGVMVNLIHLMRSLQTQGNFVNILDFCLNGHNQYKLRPIVVSAMSYCGSPALEKDLSEIYKRLTTTEFNMIITGLPATIRPDFHTIQALVDLLKTVQSQTTRDQIILTIGSIYYSICHRLELVCPLFYTNYMIQMFTELYDKCETNVNKLVVLRAIGNSGLPMTTFLKTIIYNSQLPTEVRESAIIAMRRCGEVDLVTEVLLPVYRNEGGLFVPELRIVAFTALIEVSPTVDMLTLLTARMQEETCKQVGNFVYSYLNNLVQLPTIFEPTKQLTVAAQMLLPSIKRFEDGLMFSKNIQFHIAALSRRMAKLIAGNNLNVPGQFLPRAVNLRLMSYFSGFYSDLMEVGFRMEGLDRLVENIWRLVYSTDSNGNTMSTLLDDRTNREIFYIQNFLNENEVVNRPVEQTRGFIFFRHLGNELGIFHTDRYTLSDVDTLVQTVTDLDSTFRWFTVMPLMPTVNLKIQSMIGMPFKVHYHAVAMIDLKSQRINNDDILARSFTPRILVKGMTRVGTDFGLLKTCVGHNAQLKTVLPVNVIVTRENGRLSYELFVNVADRQLTQQIFQLGLFPVVSRTQLNLPRVTFEETVEEMVLPVMSNELQYSTEIQGLKVNVNTHVNGFTFRQPMFPLCGRYMISLEWTSNQQIKPFGVQTVFSYQQGDNKVLTEMMLNPRVLSVSQQLNLGLSLTQEANQPTLKLEVEPKWTDKLYRMYMTLQMTRGQINPSFSWLEAGQTRPLEFVLKAQFGNKITYNPQQQDLVIKTTLCKSDLQKRLEQLDTKIESSDCYKCEQNKDSWTNVYCDRCIFKRSFLTEIDSKVFMNKDKLVNNELLGAWLTRLTLNYLDVIETQFYLDQDITETLAQTENQLLRQSMPQLLSGGRLTTIRVIDEIHPYFTDKNLTIYVNKNKLVMSRIPLLPAFRRLYDLPENRITDVVTDRYITPNQGKCYMDGYSQIFTFDRVELSQQTQQRNDCDQLLVKDCTKDRKFEISTQLVNNMRGLKVLVGKTLLKIVPQGNTYIVHVKNKQQQFRNGRIETPEFLVDLHQIVTPQQTREQKLVLVVKSQAVTCNLVKDLVSVQVPCWMRGQVCGLCGDKNGENQLELTLPNMSQATNLQQFLQSYTECNGVYSSRRH